jgi:ABC-type glycerol-3-phosphate transport system substrate-binding protein
MKNLKKILGLLLCLVMVASMLTACQGETDVEDTTAAVEDTTAAEGEETEATAEDVTITIGIYPEEGDTENIALHEGYIAKMAELNPNVTCEPAPYTYAVDTFVPLAESGNCPTFFETWYTEPAKLIAGGYVRDITDILEGRGWLDMMADSVKKLLSDADGKVYGIPRDGYVLGLMVNVDMFKEAGLVDENGVPMYPETWEQLAEYAKKIKDATGQAGIVLQGMDNGAGWHFSNISWAFGAELVLVNEDGTYKSNLGSDEAIAAMEYVKSLRWEYDVLTADPTVENWGTGFEHIAAGTAAMYIAANDAVNQPANMGLSLDSFALGALPAGPSGEAYGLTGGTPYMFAADATDAEVEAALDYLMVMGKSPVIDETVKQGMMDGAKTNNELGVPVIKGVSGWVSADRDAAEAEVLAEYGNVNEALYADYFDFIANGNIKAEEPGKTQSMYACLTKVLQEVYTNENADVPALMAAAQEEYQAILDDPNAE